MLTNRINTRPRLPGIFTILIAAGFSVSAFAQANVDQLTAEGENRADAGAAEQQRVEAIADQTEALLADYKTVTKVVDGLKIYNGLLQRQVDNQEKEKTELTNSIDNVALIETSDRTDDDPHDRLTRRVHRTRHAFPDGRAARATCTAARHDGAFRCDGSGRNSAASSRPTRLKTTTDGPLKPTVERWTSTAIRRKSISCASAASR